jgi:lysophospholipase L1-like esterase
MAEPQRDDTFAYSNRNDRAPGRLVTVAGWVVPGVARVQDQVGPYAAAWQRSNQAALAADGPLWVALGDSLSQGIGAGAYDRGWVGQLRSRLAAGGRPYRVVNLSVYGARAEDVLDRQLPALADVANRAGMPDLITLMIGSNDLMSRRNRSGLPRRFDRILRQLPPGAVVTTLPNPTHTAAQVNAVIAAVARERGLVIVDLRDSRTTSWRGRLAADHFHPNERGYTQLADVIADAVETRAPNK